MTDRTTATFCPDESDLLATVRRGFDLVQVDPMEAESILSRVRDEPRTSADARVIALWGLGRLAHDRGAIVDALTVYTDAVAMAVDTGLSELAAQVRMSWAVCLQASGLTDEALAQLEMAEPYLTGAPLGRLLMQRGVLLTFLGERAAAVAAYDTALPLLLDAGDELASTRLISNRGVALLQLGHTARARADLLRSQEMASRLGQHVLAAGSLHNLAYLDGRVGRFPAALRGFAEARVHYAAVGSPGRYVGDLDIDECEVLIEAGLEAEAAEMATRVVDAARASGNAVQLAEALVALARSRLMLGDAAGTEAIALEAATLFTQARRTAWAALARYLAIVAVDRQSDRRRTAVRQFVRLRDVADRLERHGWVSEAAEVRVLTGRHAIAAGRADVAGVVLRAAAKARRHPLARVRAEAWYAAALLAHADNDRGRVWRALDAGLRSVDVYRSTLGATELRSRAGRLGEPLASFGLRLALETGRPDVVLRWAERSRAASLSTDRTGRDEPVAADTAHNEGLMSALGELRAARLELSAGQGADGADAAALVGRVAELERTVTRRARHRAGATLAVETGSATGLDVAALRRAVAGANLVEFVEVDEQLSAVVAGARPWRVVTIGDTSAITVANDHLAFALRRMAMVPVGPSASRYAAAVAGAAGELDRALFGPLRHLLDSGPLVVVPTGRLHSVLWSALPTARRRHGLCLAPSAAWWMSAGQPSGRRTVLLVAGPGIRHAEAEVGALARLYPRARVLTGSDATVRAVGEAMTSSALVHIAAHGVFRADNPMFSTILLHDGPLSVHDLEALPRVPGTIVLSSCSSGRSGVLPGDELLGTSAALMSLGVRALAAPLLPIADEAAVPVTMALHRGMRRGRGISGALADCLVAADRAGDTGVFAAAASFSCFASQDATPQLGDRNTAALGGV